jgi:RNA polymerase sigma factor (sigma-70 family)
LADASGVMSLKSMVTARLVEKGRDHAASLQEQHAAFARLVQQSQPIVFALALASLRDVEDAKDASQDAFATAWHRLRQLRDPSAFEPWLKSIVVRECARRRRQRSLVPEAMAPPGAVEAEAQRSDYQDLVAAALEELPESERHVTVLFYFLGYSQPQIGRLLRVKVGTVAKRLHSARLRIRRRLPRSVRSDFVRHLPSADFVARVRRGLLDEYIGEYRFERRPDHVVRITREGDSLIGDAGGQRHVLASAGEHSLVTTHYDGEGRFRRNRSGAVTHFVYYEFGRRLGVARKIGSSAAAR